jgi:acyl-CoA dehydrogenase
MDFALAPDVEDLRRRIKVFVRERIMPLETSRANYDEHENISLDVLQRMRDEVRAAGLWRRKSRRSWAGSVFRSSAAPRATRK